MRGATLLRLTLLSFSLFWGIYTLLGDGLGELNLKVSSLPNALDLLLQSNNILLLRCQSSLQVRIPLTVMLKLLLKGYFLILQFLPQGLAIGLTLPSLLL